MTSAQKSLITLLGAKWVSVHPNNRLLYSRDMMSGNVLDLKAKISAYLPDIVCWPETTEEISKIIRLANQHRMPVVPFGAGSGVSGGTIPVEGGILLDLKRMNQIEKIEEKDGRFLITTQLGIIGQDFEQKLNTHKITLGHFPSSIFCATLGGYLACRSAGQLSSKYGKIEDMVEDIEAVLPTGEIIRFGGKINRFPKTKPKDILVGTEGCLGIITRAKLKAHPLPTETLYCGIKFAHLSEGLASMRHIMQSGLRPSVVRLYDPLDSLLFEHAFGGRSLSPPEPLICDIKTSSFAAFFRTESIRSVKSSLTLKTFLKKNLYQFLCEYPTHIQKMIEFFSSHVVFILGFEGEKSLVKVQQKMALEISKRFHGKDLGEKPGNHWLKHRYSVSSKLTEIFGVDAFVDTIEVATTWDKLMSLYKAIKKVLTPNALLLAHFSHAYPEGCSIYFTMLGRTGHPDKDRELYRALWQKAMDACLRVGGTISHHHGIGLLKAKFLPKELGTGMSFFRKMKTELDPNNIMNPGKMGL